MVEIIDETNSWPDLDSLEKVLNHYLVDLSIEQDVTVVLCDDDFIRELNLEHRGLDEATDVLSYPLHEPDDVNMPVVSHLGDIFISVDTAAAQAKDHQLSVTQEVLTLAAHGLTHLRGFDHPTEEAWHPFHEAQKHVLRLAGDL